VSRTQPSDLRQAVKFPWCSKCFQSGKIGIVEIDFYSYIYAFTALSPIFYQLALRTVSSSRSAYACFLFNESFFISYDDGSGDQPADSQEEDLFKCKIAMKVSGIILHSTVEAFHQANL